MNHYLQVFGRQIQLTEEQAAELKGRFLPPEQKLAEIGVGETFFVGSHEFVVLEQCGDTTAAIRKELLHEGMEFGGGNNFDGSKVDAACRKFADELAGIVGEENLVEHTVDLTSDDGLKDYGQIRRRVSLLTAELYRRCVDVLDLYQIKKYWWLATPNSTERHENADWVRCVAPSGYLINDNCYDDFIGVRPFCIFKSHIFVSN